MKKWRYLLFGLIPFLFGYLLNLLILRIPLPLAFLGIVCFMCWGVLGFLWGGRETCKNALILLHLPALLDLILVFVQEVLLGRYFLNVIGALSQYFYLPFLPIAFRLVPFAGRVIWGYLAAFLLMVVSFLIGSFVRRKKEA